MPANHSAHQAKFVCLARYSVIACLIAGCFGTVQAAAQTKVGNVPQSDTSRTAASERVRHFVAGSLTKIIAEREGKPFVLAFWSASCAYCPEELRTLGEIRKTNPKLDVVLVAADSPDEAPLAAELAARYGLGKVEQWVFAGEAEERLRFEIDRRWHGELPRTHLYDRKHRIEVVSGSVPRKQLLAWVKANVQ